MLLIFWDFGRRWDENIPCPYLSVLSSVERHDQFWMPRGQKSSNTPPPPRNDAPRYGVVLNLSSVSQSPKCISFSSQW